LTGNFGHSKAIMSAMYAPIDEFAAVLGWVMNQRPDSPYSHYSIFRVGFEDPQLLGSTFGAADAMHRLNQFGGTLAATVRKTDIVTREVSVFWVLTPECNAEMVGCRLCEIAGKVKQFGLDVGRCTVGAWLFPLPGATESTARTLLARLKMVPPAYKFEPAEDCAVSWAVRTGSRLDQYPGKIQNHCYRAKQGLNP